jgi:16S rRNA (guanine966-N2)-methyltransferase
VRIIAGEFRGRRLLPPEGDVTRPITDRVKQSLFDILSPIFAAEGDLRVYDCFAGTGSMGLESISRGASHVTFFEADRSAAKLLRRNIEALRVGSVSEVVSGDLFAWFDAQPKRDEGGRARLVFLDPPYRLLTEHERAADLRRLARRIVERQLRSDGTVVFRHDAGDVLSLPGLQRYDERTYGGMMLEFLRPGDQ